LTHRSMTASPLTFVHRLEPEDRARADFYGVLSALYADAPSEQLLRAIADAQPLPDALSGTLPHAWNRLRDACGAMDPEAAQQEYWDLFVGTGNEPVGSRSAV